MAAPDEIVDPCEHQEAIVLDQDEFASLSEGQCHNCGAPGQTVDGWSVCSCCGAAWQMTRKHLVLRIPYFVEPQSGTVHGGTDDDEA